MEDEEYREWAWLSKNLVHSIVDKLRRTEDVIRFSAVCREWRSVAAWNFRGRSQVPLMMSRCEGSIGDLHSVTEKKKYKIRLPLPENMKCRGSCLWGWLIMLDSAMYVVLFNPFSGATVTFPPINRLATEYRDEPGVKTVFTLRGVFTADPAVHPDDYVFMVMYNYRLAFFKSGASDWTEIIGYKLDDIIYWRGQIYGIDWYESLLSFEFINSTDFRVKIVGIHPKAMAVKMVDAPPKTSAAVVAEGFEFYAIKSILDKSEPNDFVCVAASFLAESCEGDLLCILKIEHLIDNIYCRVYEIADKGGNVGWVRRDDLGDSALFVGDSNSVSVSAFDIPGCQPNSVYFLDKENEIDEDFSLPFQMGVCNLKHQSISRDYQLTTSEMLKSPPPLWIFPTMHMK